MQILQSNSFRGAYSCKGFIDDGISFQVDLFRISSYPRLELSPLNTFILETQKFSLPSAQLTNLAEMVTPCKVFEIFEIQNSEHMHLKNSTK